MSKMYLCIFFTYYLYVLKAVKVFTKGFWSPGFEGSKFKDKIQENPSPPIVMQQ